MKVTLPSGRFIGPGLHIFHTMRVEEEEVWWMGNLIETKIHEIHETHQVTVPDPGMDGPEDDENSWPLRGEFTFADRTFTVVRDDDIGFWGFRNGESLTKQEWLEGHLVKHREFMRSSRDNGWWELNQFEDKPLPHSLKISKAHMEAENKPLMAHLMVDLGFFPSVSQAKKNGWDKPLEIGRHELGPKKNRTSVEILP